MALAADRKDASHHIERLIETGVLENREDGAEFFARKSMFLSDFVFLNDQELLVGRDLKSRERGNFYGRSRNRIRSAMSFRVPISLFQKLLFLGVDQVAAFF